MSQLDLNEAHAVFRTSIKYFYKIAYLDFIPNCRFPLFNWLKMSILPLLNVLAGVISIKTIISLIGTSYDIVQFLYLIVLPLCYWQAVCKLLFCCVIFRNKFKDVIEFCNDIVQDRNSLMGSVRPSAVVKELKFGITLGKAFIVCASISLGAFIISTAQRTNFEFICYFKYPYIERESILYFPLNIGLQANTLIYTIGFIIYVDAIVFLIAEYFKGEFGTISKLLLKLNEGLTNVQCKRIIFTCYRSHVTTSNKLKILQEICWYIYLNQIYTSVLYMCMVLYMMRFGDSSITFYIVPPGVMAQICLLCYTGQIIRDGTMEVSDTLGMINWYRLNIVHQKYLILFMVFAQRSKGMHTFAFKDLDMTTYLQLLKAIFSYCAFLYTVLS
ncbi:hypothetical protein DMENIID0001_013040 [Sergentomyia squamirostris]